MKISIDAKMRKDLKKSELKKLRNDGFLPAVIYGEGKEAVQITLDYPEFYKKYKKTIGHVAIFNINVEGKQFNTVLKDKQIHPTKRDYLHVDFLELHAGKEFTVEVPINYTGTAIGTKKGGVLDTILRSLEVTCLPKDIVDDIQVDISNLDVNQAIYLKDIELPNMITKLNPETALVVVTTPKMVEEAETDAEGDAEAAEPELIKSGKDKDE